MAQKLEYSGTIQLNALYGAFEETRQFSDGKARACVVIPVDDNPIVSRSKKHPERILLSLGLFRNDTVSKYGETHCIRPSLNEAASKSGMSEDQKKALTPIVGNLKPVEKKGAGAAPAAPAYGGYGAAPAAPAYGQQGGYAPAAPAAPAYGQGYAQQQYAPQQAPQAPAAPAAPQAPAAPAAPQYGPTNPATPYSGQRPAPGYVAPDDGDLPPAGPAAGHGIGY